MTVLRFRQRVFNKRVIAIVLAAVMSFTAVFTSSAQTKRKTYSNNIKHQKIKQSVVLESSDSYYLNKELVKNSKRLRVGATAYCNDPITFTGTVPEVGRTIAVDPNVIPLGSKVYIPQFNRVFIAEDTGGKIKGLRIDVYMEDYDTCMNWGFKDIDIYILNN
jgi:3D (Asp-Asp-Asp) domain-containing protein